MTRKDFEHRGYRVIAAEIGGKPMAQIYTGKQRVGGVRFEGVDLDSVSEEARNWIDARVGASRELQRAPHIATANRYAEFLRAETLGDHERAMLIAHAKARVLTATALADAAGWDSYGSANIHYGYLGRKAATRLGLELPTRKNGEPIFTYALAEDAVDGRDLDTAHFQWAIHPELVDAMVVTGMLNDPPQWLGESIPND